MSEVNRSRRTTTSRRYTDEEKAAAVRLVRTLRAELGTGQGTVKRVADQLGYGVESVRTWVKQAEIDHGLAPGVSTEEPQRLRDLEQEVRELRRANEILRRAAGFFAAELDRPSKRWSPSSTRTRTTSSTVAGSGSSPSAGCCRWPRAVLRGQVPSAQSTRPPGQTAAGGAPPAGGA